MDFERRLPRGSRSLPAVGCVTTRKVVGYVVVSIMFGTSLVGGFTADLAAQLLRYRSGESDDAVREVASWSANRLRDEIAAIPTDLDPLSRAALALLHAEANVHLGDHRAGAQLRRMHWDRAEAIVRDLWASTSEGHDRRIHDFVRDWSLVRVPGDEWPYLRRRFPDDPQVLLAYGRWLEYWMPRIESGNLQSYGFMVGPVVIGTSHGRFGQEAFEAIGTLRRVLELEPSLVEARVRVGRVLWQLDRWDEAERELRRAFSDATALPATGNDEWAYLAGMFLGQLLEERRRLVDAHEAYAHALAAYPDGQVVSLRLTRLTLMTGAGVPDSRKPSLNTPGNVDPWTIYFTRQQGGPEVRLRWRALRPLVQLKSDW